MEDTTLTIPTTERSLSAIIKAALLAPITLGMVLVALIACLVCPPAVAALFCGVALLAVSCQAGLFVRAFFGTFTRWLTVGLILAVPSFQASVVYGQVHTFGITVQQAIAQLGITDMEWIVIRALAVIFVGALDGIAAYAAEGTQKSVAEQVAEMEAKAQLAKASAKLNQARATAWGKAAKGTFKGVFSDKEEDETEDANETPPMEDEKVIPMNRKGKNGGKRKKVVSESVVRERIYRLLEKNPNMPLNEIMKRGHVSLSTASKYKNLYRAEQAS